MKPQRIQLSRKGGFSIQKYSLALNGLPAVNCARPSRWGNPFRVSNSSTSFCAATVSTPDAATAVAQFLALVKLQPDFMEAVKRELKGKNLACWCDAGQPCHCDVLLEIANS